MIVVLAERTFDGGPNIAAIKSLAARFPGTETLRIDVGASRLNLGPAWGVSQCTGLLVALTEFGAVEVQEDQAAV